MPISFDIRSLLIEHLAADVEVAEQDGRFACLTPLEYPSGDGVVVWVSPQPDGQLLVSDYSAALEQHGARQPQDLRALLHAAKPIAADLGVAIDAGRVSQMVRPDDLGSAIWLVAMASNRVATLIADARGRRPRKRSREFVDAVASYLERHEVHVERNVDLAGSSGHVHRTSLYVPDTETVLEPLPANAPWTTYQRVFVEFSDIRMVNGHKLLAIVDSDDGAVVHEEGLNLLTAVGSVLDWGHREEWLPSVRTEREK